MIFNITKNDINSDNGAIQALEKVIHQSSVYSSMMELHNILASEEKKVFIFNLMNTQSGWKLNSVLKLEENVQNSINIHVSCG